MWIIIFCGRWKDMLDMKDQNKNIFVVGVDMESRTAEDIARDAVSQIVAITACLVEQQKNFRNF